MDAVHASSLAMVIWPLSLSRAAQCAKLNSTTQSAVSLTMTLAAAARAFGQHASTQCDMSRHESTVKFMLLFGELQLDELVAKARPTAYTACADDVDTAVKADEPSLEPSVPPRPGDQECESGINPPVTRTLSPHQSHTAAAASDHACVGDRGSQRADSTVDAASGVRSHASESQPADSTDVTCPGTTALQQLSLWPTPAPACWQRTQVVVARVAALLEWMLSPVQLDQLAQNLHAPGRTCEWLFAEKIQTSKKQPMPVTVLLAGRAHGRPLPGHGL